ncbi:MAG: M56 family metallopeptidase, partial [Actinomycetota bacterium]
GAIAAVGCGLLVARLAWQGANARRVVRESNECERAPWRRAFDAHRRRFALPDRIGLRESSVVGSPGIVGLWRPVVIVPTELAATADAGVIDSVLLHELTHVARGDYAVRIGWRSAECLAWYNPLVWLASARAREAAERVCDAYCVDRLGGPRGYAAALLTVARLLVGRRSSSAIVA